MTKRVTVSLPDDVAAFLDGADNASAAVAEALRAHMNRATTTEAMLRAAGMDVTAGRGRLAPLSSAQQEEIRQRREALRSGRWQADSASAA